MPQPRLLLVEDEPALRRSLTDRLHAEGYHVEAVGDGPTAVIRSASEAFDVIVLDVMLPGLDGFEVLRTIRARGVTTPVLMLTARNHLVDKVVGFKMGADDYLTKPFEARELTVRLEALRRRVPAAPGASGARYAFGDVMVDVRKAEVTRAGRRVDLSAKEFHLLRYFLEHRGAALSREELLHAVWGHQNTPSARTVDTHVLWLRQKLEPNPKVPQYIVTVHGLGYRLAE